MESLGDFFSVIHKILQFKNKFVQESCSSERRFLLLTSSAIYRFRFIEKQVKSHAKMVRKKFVQLFSVFLMDAAGLARVKNAVIVAHTSVPNTVTNNLATRQGSHKKGIN